MKKHEIDINIEFSKIVTKQLIKASVAAIDDHFGEGYAKDHPYLLIAVLNVIADNFDSPFEGL